MTSSGLASYALAGGSGSGASRKQTLELTISMAQPGLSQIGQSFSRLHHDGVVLLLSIAAHQTSVQHQAPLDPSGPIWCDAFSRWNSLAVSRAVGLQ